MGFVVEEILSCFLEWDLRASFSVLDCTHSHILNSNNQWLLPKHICPRMRLSFFVSRWRWNSRSDWANPSSVMIHIRTNILLSIFLDFIFLFFSFEFIFPFSLTMKRHVTAVTWHITWCEVIGLEQTKWITSRSMSTAWLPHEWCMDIRAGVIICIMDHV